MAFSLIINAAPVELESGAIEADGNHKVNKIMAAMGEVDAHSRLLWAFFDEILNGYSKIGTGTGRSDGDMDMDTVDGEEVIIGGEYSESDRYLIYIRAIKYFYDSFNYHFYEFN